MSHADPSDRYKVNMWRNDPSNGYDAVAADFMSRRTDSTIGAEAIRQWAKTIHPGVAVLDLGCGHGVPITQVLLDQGLDVYAIDASPTMVAEFRERFPQTQVRCEDVQDSSFFGRQFDGIVAWGLMFLLSADVQASLIQKAAAALKPGGKFVFTAPHQKCEWSDNLTGQTSSSLGSESYRQLVEAAALSLVAESEDEGQNHYYFTLKPSEYGADGTTQTSRAAMIGLRKATRDDLALIRHWDEQPHVVAADPNDYWAWEEELKNPPPGCEQLIAELDGRPIGFIQIIDPYVEETRYWGDVPAGLRAIDIWIGEATDLGKGYGTKMMQLALNRCFSSPDVTAVLIDPLESNTRAHRFYERLGFRFVEKRRFGKDDCFVYQLIRGDWEQSQLNDT